MRILYNAFMEDDFKCEYIYIYMRNEKLLLTVSSKGISYMK